MTRISHVCNVVLWIFSVLRLLVCSQQDTYNSGSEDDDRRVEEECDSLSAAIMYQYQKIAESGSGECSYDTAAESRRKRYQKDSYFSDEEELDDWFWVQGCYFVYNVDSGVNSSLVQVILVKWPKMHQLWNDIQVAQNYKDQFWWNLAEIFKRLYNGVCMFQFSCRFAFLSTFRLSNRTPKITQILTL